jgi:Flp pilus assembly protein TadG
VAPILVILILGIVDVGQYVNVGQTVSNASREGARVAARTTTLSVSDVENSVSGYLAESFAGVPSETLSEAVDVNVTDGYGCSIADGDLTAVAAGSPLSVEVTLSFNAVRWLNGVGLANDRTLSITTVMRRE